MSNSDNSQLASIFSTTIIVSVIKCFGLLFDELEIYNSVPNQYDESINLICRWNRLEVSINNNKYIKYYKNYPQKDITAQAGYAYVTCIIGGYLIIILVYIPFILECLPYCNCINSLKRSKIFLIRFGTFVCGLMWLVASIDWMSTEECCLYWYININPMNDYNGLDCDYYLSIYLLLVACGMCFCITIYTLFIWDIEKFNEFNEEQYFHL